MVNTQQPTKINQVIDYISERIQSRQFLVGSKLPSLRKLAQTLQVSVSTVLEAYERLLAENLIEVRRGSGYFVLNQQQATGIDLPSTQAEMATHPFWVAHQALIAHDAKFTPGCGWLPTNWMPEAIVRKSLRHALNASAEDVLAYSPVLGFEPLRELLSQRIQHYGVNLHPDQVLLTENGTHALDLICRTWLKPGDVVVVDDPCYFNFFTLLELLQVRVIAVPFTPNGPDLNAFAEAMQAAPKLYITNAGPHNPTGASLNLAVAYQVLKMAEQANMLIIEDDVYADFELVPAPRYAALSNFEQVIQIGSFSKSLSAAFRCGYIAAKSEYIDLLVKVKIATSFSCNQLNSLLVYQTLKHAQYRRHLDYINQRLNEARRFVVGQLEDLGIVPWTIPKAGMFLWCQLPQGVQAESLVHACRQDHVILAAGTNFSHSPTAQQFMRFNISQCVDPSLFELLAKHIA
ncbi:PLP-dependent aminotransferase family protein [Acinetobacter sp. MD2(2019)]|uniref:aminotransferase-like domain-containing protein n=1 Tax=Acinetobacter sp. MD2(2019) TaxID=2605273 RepID=UPI002D1E6679|nr:PLP-dependent aminotransferase family protein [Acinetobacter sp. MD2(2019)]MEB3754453.1 PLP-dependent aminotransferase family protein [Acinetobacter sp. MD2(2019)]